MVSCEYIFHPAIVTAAAGCQAFLLLLFIVAAESWLPHVSPYFTISHFNCSLGADISAHAKWFSNRFCCVFQWEFRRSVWTSVRVCQWMYANVLLQEEIRHTNNNSDGQTTNQIVRVRCARNDIPIYKCMLFIFLRWSDRYIAHETCVCCDLRNFCWIIGFRFVLQRLAELGVLIGKIWILFGRNGGKLTRKMSIFLHYRGFERNTCEITIVVLVVCEGKRMDNK